MTQADGCADGLEWYRIAVADVGPEASDSVSLVLAIPPSLATVFAYSAGQYVTVRARIDGETLLRCYSMSSAPETDTDLRITVRRTAGGRVSSWLVDDVRVGDMIDVGAPAGRFCLRDGNAPVLLVGGGSGITPLLSLAKSALAVTARTVTLLYANRDGGSVILASEIAALANRYRGRFTVLLWLDEERGLPDVAGLSATGVLDPAADVYLCGPDAMMTVAETAVLAAGVPADRVLTERFTAPPAAAVTSAADDPFLASEACTRVVVTWRGQTREIAYQPGRSVLAMAQAMGFSPPYSCLEGNCASCMARVTAGEVVMVANSALTAAEMAEGYVVTCQSLPVTSEVAVAYD